MSFIKRVKEPPKLEVGETVEAEIIDIRYPVKSKRFGRENIEFHCRLWNGYECRAWIGYYEEHSDKSELAKLLLTLMRMSRQDFKNVKEGLDALKNHGKIFLKCVGYSQLGLLNYPRFKVVTDVLPSTQTQLERKPEKVAKCPNCGQPTTSEMRFCPNCGQRLT